MSDHVLELDEDAFDSVVSDSKIPILLYFTATWCGPCKALAPVIEDVAANFAGQMKCIKVDIDELPNVASKYGARGVPSLQVVSNGEVTIALPPTVRTRDTLTRALNTAIEGKSLSELIRDDPQNVMLRESFFESAPIEELEAFILEHPEFLDAPLSHDVTPIRYFRTLNKRDRWTLFKDHGAALTLDDYIVIGSNEELIAELSRGTDRLTDRLGDDLTAIMSAVAHENIFALKAFAEAGFDYNSMTPSQRSDFYRGVTLSSHRGMDVVDCLLDELRWDPSLEAKHGLACVHFAHVYRTIEFEQLLIDRGFQPDQTGIPSAS